MRRTVIDRAARTLVSAALLAGLAHSAQAMSFGEAYSAALAHDARYRAAGQDLAMAQQDKARALHMLEEGAYPDASEQVAESIVSLFEKQATTI